MEGLSILTESLFQLKLRVTTLNEGEAWAHNVFRVELVEPDCSIAGVMYLGKSTLIIITHLNNANHPKIFFQEQVK